MFISVRKRPRFKRTMLRPAGARKTRGLFWIKVKMLVTWCPILCNPMDCGPPASSVHEILQARILEWVAIPFSRRSSWPRDQTQVSWTAGRFFTVWDTAVGFIWLQSTSQWGQGDHCYVWGNLIKQTFRVNRTEKVPDLPNTTRLPNNLQ